MGCRVRDVKHMVAKEVQPDPCLSHKLVSNGRILGDDEILTPDLGEEISSGGPKSRAGKNNKLNSLCPKMVCLGPPF